MAYLHRHSEDSQLGQLYRIIQETRPPPKTGRSFSWVPRLMGRSSSDLGRMPLGADCDEVYPHIYIGDESSARNKEFLKSSGITHVLNAAEGPRFGQVSTGKLFYANSGITYLGLDIMDVPQAHISAYFDQSAAFIESCLEDGGKVLVHCLMGMSRSATLVLAYLMLKKNMSVIQGLQTIRRHRDVRPNDGFLRQLVELDNRLRGDF